MKNYEVRKIDTSMTTRWLLEKHYAKRLPSISYAFGLYKDNILEGVVTYGQPPTPYLSKTFNYGEYIELNRLVVNSGLIKNSLSFFVSMSLKLLKKINNFVVVSYADPNNGHNGYIYQATNWMYTGKGRVDTKDKRGVNKFFYKEKEFHERHIPEVMRAYKFSIDLKSTKNENWKSNGGVIISQERKHRYFFLLGCKRFVKENKTKLLERFTLYEYPKEMNNRYECIDIKWNDGGLF